MRLKSGFLHGFSKVLPYISRKFHPIGVIMLNYSIKIITFVIDAGDGKHYRRRTCIGRKYADTVFIPPNKLFKDIWCSIIFRFQEIKEFLLVVDKLDTDTGTPFDRFEDEWILRG